MAAFVSWEHSAEPSGRLLYDQHLDHALSSSLLGHDNCPCNKDTNVRKEGLLRLDNAAI
ncbi:MAG: hypothetical protein KC505_06275 [Myxococcales bacterium]|nr:hypothetical protein [Myxococcales bacterium]